MFSRIVEISSAVMGESPPNHGVQGLSKLRRECCCQRGAFGWGAFGWGARPSSPQPSFATAPYKCGEAPAACIESSPCHATKPRRSAGQGRRPAPELRSPPKRKPPRLQGKQDAAAWAQTI